MAEREKEKDRARRQASSGKGPGLASVDPDKEEFNGYAECYPGLMEMNDAIEDSDDEVDYTKMDLVSESRPVLSQCFYAKYFAGQQEGSRRSVGL